MSRKGFSLVTNGVIRDRKGLGSHTILARSIKGETDFISFFEKVDPLIERVAMFRIRRNRNAINSVQYT